MSDWAGFWLMVAVVAVFHGNTDDDKLSIKEAIVYSLTESVER